MENLAIYGVGGFGREVQALILSINNIHATYNVIGFFDDGHPKGEIINGIPTLGSIDDLNKWNDRLCVVIAVGNPFTKKSIIKKITNPKIIFPTLIHPNVWIGDERFVKIGKGCIICAGNMITTNIVINDFVILNLGCTVGHDSVIGKYSAFMPSVNISGEVNIGNLVYVGTGVKIINQLEIGEGTIIGAGAVVTKTLPSNCTVVGVPAKVIKYQER